MDMGIALEPLGDEEDAPLADLAGDTAAAIEELRAEARVAAEASRAPSSERAYAADWRDFSAFATRIGRERLPAEPETVALYVADLRRRGRRPATIARKLAAIAVYHGSTGHATPTSHDVVRAVVRGTRRQLGVAQQQKTALELDALRAVLAAIPEDLRGLRDRVALLVGWAAALRRSELAALDISDVAYEREGMVLAIRRSKTDREAAGDVVAVPYGAEEATCPVRTLRRWLDAAAITNGRVLRRVDRHGNIGAALSDRALANMVAARAAAAGLDGDFAAHSLRSGFATAAARAGRLEAAIVRHGRWKSVQVARRYIRAGTRWDDPISGCRLRKTTRCSPPARPR
ncbi:MAG: tyrosine-type recombinase/integrase [Candidatus Eremiobacteraeota bacterium]|nr:tyrosine-type recombinase/integrase [Candidatus Eremiobacteraeota bacterium]